MENNEVNRLMLQACRDNDCAHLIYKIRWDWSQRMTVSIGAAVRKGDDFTIKLSAKLFARTDYEEQKDTVIHETCHIIDGYVNDAPMSHGEGWKRAMRRAGQEPSRCHTVNIDGLVKRWIYTCPCDIHKFSTRMHNQISSGRGRVCRNCDSRLSFTGQVEGA